MAEDSNTQINDNMVNSIFDAELEGEFEGETYEESVKRLDSKQEAGESENDLFMDEPIEGEVKNEDEDEDEDNLKQEKEKYDSEKTDNENNDDDSESDKSKIKNDSELDGILKDYYQEDGTLDHEKIKKLYESDRDISKDYIYTYDKENDPAKNLPSDDSKDNLENSLKEELEKGYKQVVTNIDTSMQLLYRELQPLFHRNGTISLEQFKQAYDSAVPEINAFINDWKVKAERDNEWKIEKQKLKDEIKAEQIKEFERVNGFKPGEGMSHAAKQRMGSLTKVFGGEKNFAKMMQKPEFNDIIMERFDAAMEAQGLDASKLGSKGNEYFRKWYNKFWDNPKRVYSLQKSIADRINALGISKSNTQYVKKGIEQAQNQQNASKRASNNIRSNFARKSKELNGGNGTKSKLERDFEDFYGGAIRNYNDIAQVG